MDAAVDTKAEFADCAFADVESGLAVAAEALQADGPAAAMRTWAALADQFPSDPRIFRQAIATLASQCAWAETEWVANAAAAAFPHDMASRLNGPRSRKSVATGARRSAAGPKCARVSHGTQRVSLARHPPCERWVSAKRRKLCSSAPWGCFRRNRGRRSIGR